MENENTHNEISKTLSSLDNWERLETDDFFTSRVLNRLDNQDKKTFRLTPLMKAAVIISVVFINSLSLNYFFSSEKKEVNTETNLTALLSEEYSLSGYDTDNEYSFE